MLSEARLDRIEGVFTAARLAAADFGRWEGPPPPPLPPSRFPPSLSPKRMFEMMAISALAAMEWSPMVPPPKEDFLVRDLVMDLV